VPTRIFVAADVGATLLSVLRNDPRFELSYFPARTAEELMTRLGDAEVLVTRHHNRLTAAVLDAAPRLRLVAQGTSGLDNIDVEHAARRNVTVAGLPGENANAVAELVLGHIIALTRDVPGYNEMVRSGRWERDDCVTKRELRSFRLGIVGLGRVGSSVAAQARRFGMSVGAYDPYLRSEDFVNRGVQRFDTLEEMLQGTDILTMHVPLTRETRQMIGRKELEMLPSRSFVINASRGPVLDQNALFALLHDDLIAGAALDVFDQEPPTVEEWPAREKLILTPHIAGCSKESKESIGLGLYQLICNFLSIKPHVT